MKLAVLGATGSIGQSALAIARAFPEYVEIAALTCASQVEIMAEAVLEFRPPLVAVAGEAERAELLKILYELECEKPPEILCGPEGQTAAATESGADTVLSAIMGGAAMPPTFAAIKKGLRVALANKESMVMGGDLLMPLARKTGAEIVPVDSEHSAIFQALGGRLSAEGIHRLILTASGGPFRGFTAEQLAKVKREQALRHPRWEMGAKITCDSATLMNKGLEIIEAHHLFGLPYEQIDVLIHPQSVVHSIVEYVDGSQVAQMGPTDMRLPIAYALSCPARWPLLERLHLNSLPLSAVAFQSHRGHLTFEAADWENFPALSLAVQAGKEGGTAPAVLSGADEAAVGLFLAGRIGFTDIARLVGKVLDKIPARPVDSIETAMAAEGEARKKVEELALK